MNAHVEQVMLATRERILACTCLVRSDHTCYGKLLEDLKSEGTNNYPATLQQAYPLLVHWKHQDPCNIVHLIGGINDGVAFMTVSIEGGCGRGARAPSATAAGNQVTSPETVQTRRAETTMPIMAPRMMAMT